MLSTTEVRALLAPILRLHREMSGAAWATLAEADMVLFGIEAHGKGTPRDEMPGKAQIVGWDRAALPVKQANSPE